MTLSVWRFLNARARYYLMVLLMLNIGVAILEAASAALIVSFIAMVSNPDYIFTQQALSRTYTALSMSSPSQFQIFTASVLLLFFAAKNGYAAATINFQCSFIYREMSRTAEAMFARYLAKPFEYHIQTNSSILIRNVSNEVHTFFTNVVVALLTLFTEVAVIIAMTAVLLWLSPAPVLIAILVLGGVTLGFHLLVRRKVVRYGVLQQTAQAQRIKSISQGLGGIKEIKVLGREAFFVGDFGKHEGAFSEVTRYAMVLNQMPRLFMETVAFSTLFLVVVGALLSDGGTVGMLPTVALFAVAALRLMPSVNRIQNALTRIHYYRPSVQVVFEDGHYVHLEATDKVKASEIGFRREIVLRDISYTYPGASSPSLESINLTIPKGASVALVGPSGAGKTTLVDITLGLLKPTSGVMLVDGLDVNQDITSWRRHLGYIPQTIFLLDDNIRRNVAFGIPDHEIDDCSVWAALELAQLKSHVETLPLGLDCIVGERGVSLSGGQRQRVGIARALYNNPDVLIMDEATSSLDPETEREISQSINVLADTKTLIIIAHRPATIEQCSLRFHLEKGRILQMKA